MRRTVARSVWLKALRDPIGKARILARLRAAELGHFGDHAAVGDAVFELRIHTGRQYRVYCWRQHGVTYWLLRGGETSERQLITRRRPRHH